MVKSILMESLPRWYDLRLGEHSFVLEIHPDVVEEVKKRGERFLEKSDSRYLFREELLRTSGRWGYCGVCKNVEPKMSGWAAVEFELLYGDVLATAGCAETLSLMLASVSWLQPEIGESLQKQLLVVTGLLNLEQLGGWALSVDISNELYCWIKEQGTKQSPEIVATMKQFWMWMDGRRTVKHWGTERFQAAFQNGGLYLSVPGNAADLTPSIGSLGDIREIGDGFQMGYRLEPHNIDSPLQQLTLLAGVIKLREFSGL